MLGQHEISPSLRRRLNVSIALALLLISLLAGRLWKLQVLDGEDNRRVSEENRIRIRRVQATRGTILDRLGRVLVDSRASYDAVLVPEDVPNMPATVEALSQYLKQGTSETQAILHQNKGQKPFQEIVIKRDLDREELVALETHQLETPGVSIRVTPRRSYPLGPVLAHVLGYVGEVNQEEIERDPGYRPGDLTGKAGLERIWERQLRGTNGGQEIEVDALGRELRVLHEVAEVPGSTLVLTIDLDLQHAAENALGDRVGSIVALDPRNGETLAIVNHPSFDPNIFARGVRQSEWKELSENPRHPLTHRAIHGQYPPGSTFKIVMAAAALAEGIINPFTSIHCGGGLQFGNHYFRCWKKGGHGSVGVHEALVQSCDTFFYQVGQRIGIDTIASYARAFGLGLPTGIALEHEKAGIIPDSEWKKQRFGEPWYAGETLSVSIGQGYVTTTPLQLAQMIATTATGVRYRPRLVGRIERPEGEVIERFPPEEEGRLDMRKTALELVRAGLADVVARGTGKNARLDDVAVAGKTGTSQVVRLGHERVKATELPWQERDHAWFVAYAPVEDPKIAVAALVEHAEGGGGAVAAPVAREVLDRYFQLRGEKGPVRYATL